MSTKERYNPVALKFECEHVIQEDHKAPTYSVRFCDISPSLFGYFASVGANAANIYKMNNDIKHQQQGGGGGRCELILGFLDEDMDEIFYACTWSVGLDQTPLLIVAGLRGVIKGINCTSLIVDVILPGHGAAINDLKCHPDDPSLIFSVSKDESIRLWNIRTAVCIAIFSGEKGHRDEVLAIDVHMYGNCFVSVGMDTSIKIWNLKDPNIQALVAKSYVDARGPKNSCFPTYSEQYPLFSTANVHDDYVDSVRWVGDLLLTKSTKSNVVLWAPDSGRFKGAPLILHEYPISDDHIWYIRMDVSIPLDIFSVGNKEGKVFVHSISSIYYEEDCPNKYEMPDDEADNKESTHPNKFKKTENNKGKVPPVVKRQASLPIVLQHPKCTAAVRQTSFSYDGKYLVYSCDDGKILVWSITETPLVPIRGGHNPKNNRTK